jgi:hypothetical protein
MRIFIGMLAFVIYASTVSFSIDPGVNFDDLDDTYQVNLHWKKFKRVFRKRFNNTYEEYKRKVVFARHLKHVTDHNKRFKSGREMYQKAIYSFADLTPDEIRKYKKGLIIPADKKRKMRRAAAAQALPPLPATINWVKAGVVTPVEDQGYFPKIFPSKLSKIYFPNCQNSQATVAVVGRS